MAMCLIFGMGDPPLKMGPHHWRTPNPLGMKATKSPHPCAAVIDGGGIGMKFMLTFAFKPEARGRDEAIARFKKTGGQPPHGAKLLGRWTAADFSGGFDLLESDDARALTEFALMWSDVMELKVVPVVDDADLSETLRRSGR